MVETTIQYGASSSWLKHARKNPHARMRLFCFPYAGGGNLIYRPWLDQLPLTVEVCPVELPGRGHRLREPPYTDITLLVEALADDLLPYLDKPFAFFGHSMGALISFDLAQQLRKQYDRPPVHLFVSGRSAPNVPITEPPTFNLPEAEFIQELRRLKGTPNEVLENADLMQLMMPILRADFEICELYRYKPGPRLGCPITAFGGTDDGDVPRQNLEAWKELTASVFSLTMFPGDHFYLHTRTKELLQHLSQSLQQIVSYLPDTRS